MKGQHITLTIDPILFDKLAFAASGDCTSDNENLSKAGTDGNIINLPLQGDIHAYITLYKGQVKEAGERYEHNA